MSLKNNLEKINPKQKKIPTRNLIDLNTIQLEKEKNKEEILQEIKREISVCRGTGSEKKFVYKKTGEVFYNCNEHSLEEYNQQNPEQKVVIDNQLPELIYEEFIKNGYEVIITSGFRCPDHNNYSVAYDGTGATKKLSKHCLGQAVDLILKKDGKFLEIKDYKIIKQEIFDKYQYENWQKMYPNLLKKDPDLDNTPNKFFVKYYSESEGRDPDNHFQDQNVCYIHIDTRGIVTK